MKVAKTKYNRRSFLKTSAAAGGGLMIAFNWFACTATGEEEVVRVPASEWFEMNAYVKVGDNGQVTIQSPNPEIGQNIKTSMPMILAEEMDIKWEDVVVEQAALNTNWYQRQVAGGSDSIRTTWDALRMAGAAAKYMLVAAAAKQWEVEPSECTVVDGMITNKAGESVSYGEIAGQATDIEVPEELPLKEMKDFKIIGTSRGNVDIDNIITGKPLFGIDTKKEGMSYAVVMRPPVFGATLTSFDDTEARKVNGVTDVIQIKVPLKEPGRTADKIAVIANSTWAAMKGKKAIKAEWKNPAKVESTADFDKQMVAAFDKPSKNIRREDGDVKKAFAEADEIVERLYESPFLPHNCMEPMNFFAHVTDDKAELLGPIQTPEWTRGRTASLLGWLKEGATEEETAAAFDKIEVGMTRMGGGFGRRLYGDFAIEAVEISRQTGKPIQVVFTREDDMEAGTYRPALKYKIRAAIKDNQITGYHLAESGINANMYGRLPNNFPAGAIENYQVDNYQIQSPITVGAWRAPYTNFLAYAEQSFFDEIAEKIGVDTVQLRLDLFENAKKIYDAHTKLEAEIEDEAKLAEAKKALPPKGNYEPQRFIDVIKLAAEKSGWGKAPEGTHLGFSVYFSHSTYVAEVAHVEMEGNVPKVKKVTTAVDCGILVNPDAADNLVVGGVIDGIGHAMYGDFNFEGNKPMANNFDKYRMIRMSEAPEVDVHFVKSEVTPTGLGEPTLPPAGGAIANAIKAATGERMYSQPFVKVYDVLG